METTKLHSCGSAAFTVGVAETQGRRESHEDAHFMACEETWGEFWLLDGHRGHEASHFGISALPAELGQTVREGKLPSNSRIQQGFRTVDNCLRKHLRDLGVQKAGSTVVGALVVAEEDGTYQAKIINCGDSRAILIKDPKDDDVDHQYCMMVTVDHKPNVKEEQARIEAAGGFVSSGRCPRVDGRIAVCRSIGDFDFKGDKKLKPCEQKVTCEPDIYELSGIQPGSLVFMACDGIWDVMSSKTIAKKVRDALKRDPCADLQDVAASIVRQCYKKGSADNLTVLLVRLSGCGGGPNPASNIATTTVAEVTDPETESLASSASSS